MLVKFFRKKRNGQFIRRGVLVAEKYKDKFYIGFSLCCDRDIFDSEKALEIAVGRITSSIETNKVFVVPNSMMNEFENFYDRCVSYYKKCKFAENCDNIAYRHDDPIPWM